jgi:HEAT repeat protein
MMFKAELQEEIGKAIPRIVECLKDSNSYHVRSAAVEALSSLGAYRLCPSVSLLLVS